ncbi:hypothetical protein [Terrimonas alba]|uniref:hypothetical protein n=1 Tax=Terrimonas alba TaxID=3349636 RepID=UPI0035F33204
MAGKVTEILLDKQKGYNDLISLLERGSFKNKYIIAKIYGKIPDTDNFEVLHRTYYHGKLTKKDTNDPVFTTENRILKLYSKPENGRLVISRFQ